MVLSIFLGDDLKSAAYLENASDQIKNADAKTIRETIQSKIEACFASFLEVKHPSIMLHIFYQKVLGNTF